jgi:hypothetical protein
LQLLIQSIFISTRGRQNTGQKQPAYSDVKQAKETLNKSPVHPDNQRLGWCFLAA